MAVRADAMFLFLVCVRHTGLVIAYLTNLA
jgi:hypothetical protein